MKISKSLARSAAWALLVVIVLVIGVLQLTNFLPNACQKLDASAKGPQIAPALSPTESLREFLNTTPYGSIVIICANGRPSPQTWQALRRGIVRIGARRETAPVRGASFVIVGVMDARPGSAVFRAGVQEVEIRLGEGQEIGSTGIVAPREIVAKSIGDSEGIGRAVISVDGVWLSPNEPGVNVVVIDGDGRCIRRGSFE